MEERIRTYREQIDQRTSDAELLRHAFAGFPRSVADADHFDPFDRQQTRYVFGNSVAPGTDDANLDLLLIHGFALPTIVILY